MFSQASICHFSHREGFAFEEGDLPLERGGLHLEGWGSAFGGGLHEGGLHKIGGGGGSSWRGSA